MEKLKVALQAFEGAGEEVYKNGEARFRKYFPGLDVEFSHQGPSVIFFVSGGSEKPALRFAGSNSFTVLLGDSENNSYASATEVKAYLNNHGYSSVLLNAELNEARLFLEHLQTIHRALFSLRGQRLGLIGEVSEWLIASKVSAETFHFRFGIELVEIPWNALPKYTDMPESSEFGFEYAGRSAKSLSPESKVHSVLKTAISEFQLDAVSVECFSLVKENGVTACLSLAHFNDVSLCAACEGDLASAAGMMLGKAVTGKVPWMANINRVSEASVLFSHCTIAPGYLDGYTIDTHFETGKGASIRGRFRPDNVTILRLDDTLTRAFIEEAAVTERPSLDTACRTQIEATMPPRALRILKENPLGNHHLIFEGSRREDLALACRISGIKVL